MLARYQGVILFAFSLLIGALLIWYAKNICLLAFAGIILAILLNTLGRVTQKITKLPYFLALVLGLIFIFGVLTLTFLLYSPLIYDQFALLMKQLPQAIDLLSKKIFLLTGDVFFSSTKLDQNFILSNEKILTQLVSIFSTTLGSIFAFIIFIIIGFYIAFDPIRYVNWIVELLPKKRQKKTLEILHQIWNSLHWWLVGKMLSMVVVGFLAFIGLKILNISLAFILGILAALLTFIPYVGAILSAIPAILIGFAESPLKGLYVLILYLVIHVIEGYCITPYIELKTVSIPPAWTIITQILMVTLVGGIGLALATPLLVVVVAIIHAQQNKLYKIAQ